MDPARITKLLEPFLETELTSGQLNQISIYIDLLLHWNARINLTAIRDPEEIVSRHFGESLFAANRLLPRATAARPDHARRAPPAGTRQARTHEHFDSAPQDPGRAPPDKSSAIRERVVDLGSGAGFPGIPLKVWSPQTPVTLIESNHKKTVFLREVVRALTLTDIDVYSGRAEDYPQASAPLVTMRAVERFDAILSVAAGLLAPGGRLALLTGAPQASKARAGLPSLTWTPPIPLPKSESRVLLVGLSELKPGTRRNGEPF
jgi:16S rRNA (guanine527-N7)-methyltransferase